MKRQSIPLGNDQAIARLRPLEATWNRSYRPPMIDRDWHRPNDRKPWPFVAVHVLLADGKRTEAIWTGHIWWGESRELQVEAWRAVKITRRIAA
jgi:hypothetical protein